MNSTNTTHSEQAESRGQDFAHGPILSGPEHGIEHIAPGSAEYHATLAEDAKTFEALFRKARRSELTR